MTATALADRLEAMPLRGRFYPARDIAVDREGAQAWRLSIAGVPDPDARSAAELAQLIVELEEER
jgi:hypothetical protein